ncbi:MAG: YggT family protein [Gammaproteobacteria bacterium]|nr:YggT family protein [Gammaproteobacteria bacterium]
MENLTDTAIFLVRSLFGIYLIFILLRILLSHAHAGYHNPLAQFILKVTNPLLLPLRRIIPYHRKIDLAAIALLLVVKLVQLYLYGWLQTHEILNIGAILIWSIGELLSLLLTLLFWAMIMQAILSWITTARSNFAPIQLLLNHLTAPILQPIQRFIPPIAGIDISLFIAILLIKVIDMLIAIPIIQFGVGLAM